MKSQLGAIILAVWFASSGYAAGASWEKRLPKDFASMEIESKWEIPDSETYDAIVARFTEAKSYADEGKLKGVYRLETRWKGNERKFLDAYYDYPGSTLHSAEHVLRCRRRYDGDGCTPDSSTNGLSLDWTKVQYKSTPCTIDALWFRKEVGDCELETECDKAPLTCDDVVEQKAPHVAMKALADDHKDINGMAIPVLEVADCRRRVIFVNNTTGKDAFEMSIDRTAAKQSTSAEATSGRELELEILEPPTNERVEHLLIISAAIEADFEKLQRSEKSKGGASVKPCRENP